MSAVIVDKFQEVEASKRNPFLGWRFAKNGKLCGDKKCNYCGKWFSWDSSNIEKYILDRRWDERAGEPIHCNNSLCQDYHARWIKHLNKLRDDAEYAEGNYIERKKREGKTEAEAFRLFHRLKSRGMVA